MKQLLFLIAFIPVTVIAQSVKRTESKAAISPSETPLSARQLAASSQRSNTVLLFEDFQSTDIPEIPSGWEGGPQVEQQQDNNDGIGLGTFVDAWKTGDAFSANNGGYLPVPHITNNIFAYVNDDGNPCNCDMEDVGLTTPELSFEGLENMILTFDVYSQNTFGADNISIQISTDGEEFLTLHTVSSSPEWQPVFVDLSLFDDAPSVWLRFGWSDNGFWSTGGAIDNVLVAENLDYNASILRPYIAEFTAEWDDTSILSGEYNAIPLEQAAPMVLGARIMNKGAMMLDNVVLAVSVYYNDVLQGSYNSQVLINMSSQQAEDIYITTDLVPEMTGEYVIEYELITSQDEDITDNSATRSINYTTDVYIMDEGATDSFRDNLGESFSIGNLFEIPNEGSTCYSVGVGVGTGTSVGTEIQVRLYDTNFLYINGSEPYTVTATDINSLGEEKIINIPLLAPEPLEGGQDYIAVVSYFATAFNQFTIANSGTSQEQFSVFEDEFGDWFYVTTTPLIRMNLSATVNVQDIAGTESLHIFPNPVDQQYQVLLPDKMHGEIQLMVYDFGGRLVAHEEMWYSGGILNTPVPILHLSPGIYQFTAVQNNMQTTERFVKIR